MWRLKAGWALLLGAVLCVSAAAQGGGGQKRKGAGTKTRAGGTEALTLEQQYALAVLDQLLSSSKEFDDDRLRIRTRAQVADILWRYDEVRARGLFREAFDAIASAKLENQKEGAAPASPFGAASSRLQLQSEILSLVARRDPDLAENLIASLKGARGDDDSTPPAGGDRDGRPGLYLEAATSIADTNPRRAVRLAEAGLSGGIDPSVLRVLYALRRTSPGQADALYKSVLAMARRDAEGQTTGPTIIEFLDFAFETYMRLAFPSQAVPTGAQAGPTNEPNPIDYMTGQRLLPFFTRYVPDKAVIFRGALEAIAGRMKQDALMDTVNKLTQPGGTDELVKQAESMKDSLQRNLLYFRAALSASGSGEFERALSLTEKVSDEDFRGGLDSLIRFQASSALLGKGEIDPALRYAQDVSDVRQRALLLAKIARSLLNEKNTPRASEVLAEAEKTIGRAKEGTEKAQAMLIITEVRIRLDPAQGFEAMEGTVKAFNDADSSPTAKPGGVPGVGSMMMMMLSAVLKLESPDFAPSFYLLARMDFNRAAQLAQKLTRKDRAVLAQVSACRGVLMKQSVKRP